MRKLASVRRINDVNSIPNADSIELVGVLGWQVVVKKNEYKVNDLCCYIQIDTIVPDNQTFEIGLPLFWEDCPDNIIAYQYQYIDGNFVKIFPPEPTAEENKQTAN